MEDTNARAAFTVCLFGPCQSGRMRVGFPSPSEWSGGNLGQIKREAEVAVLESDGACTAARIYEGNRRISEHGQVCYGETVDTFTARSGWGQPN